VDFFCLSDLCSGESGVLKYSTVTALEFFCPFRSNSVCFIKQVLQHYVSVDLQSLYLLVEFYVLINNTVTHLAFDWFCMDSIENLERIDI
jgi:hypothetical protein